MGSDCNLYTYVFLIKVPLLKIFFQQAFQRVYIFLDPLFQKGFKKYAFIIFFNGGLAWEPSFVCKLNFSFKFKLLKLEFLIKLSTFSWFFLTSFTIIILIKLL